MGNRMVRVADLKKDGIYFGSNPSYQISCLVEKGYVIGRDNDADRRSKFYLLTDQGLAVHAMVGKILVELEDEILEQTELGKDNLVLLREYLDRIGIMR